MTRSPDNLIWIDLETTGLDPETRVILEIACLVTDKDLNELGDGIDLVVHQEGHAIGQLDPWCVKQHAASGLLDASRASTTSLAEAEAQTLAYVQAPLPVGEVAPLRQLGLLRPPLPHPPHAEARSDLPLPQRRRQLDQGARSPLAAGGRREADEAVAAPRARRRARVDRRAAPVPRGLLPGAPRDATPSRGATSRRRGGASRRSRTARRSTRRACSMRRAVPASSSSARTSSGRVRSSSAARRTRSPLSTSGRAEARGVSPTRAAITPKRSRSPRCLHQIPATLVMPENANPAKVEATRGYGAQHRLLPADARGPPRGRRAPRRRRRAHVYVSPHDDPLVIAGQGTAACELLDDVPDLDMILAPVGGGGLCPARCSPRGTWLPKVRVIGCEPDRGR